MTETHIPAEPKKYVFIKYDMDWADEFDLEGFGIMEESEWEEMDRDIRNHFENDEGSISSSFGTNEDIELDSVSDWDRALKVSHITEAEAKFLHEKFSYGDFKTFNFGTGSGAILEMFWCQTAEAQEAV